MSLLWMFIQTNDGAISAKLDELTERALLDMVRKSLISLEIQSKNPV